MFIFGLFLHSVGIANVEGDGLRCSDTISRSAVISMNVYRLHVDLYGLYQNTVRDDIAASMQHVFFFRLPADRIHVINRIGSPGSQDFVGEAR